MGSQLSDLSLLVQNPTVPAVAGLSSSWFLQCWFRSLCHILHPAPEPDSPLPVSAMGSPGPTTAGITVRHLALISLSVLCGD